MGWGGRGSATAVVRTGMTGGGRGLVTGRRCGRGGRSGRGGWRSGGNVDEGGK